MMGYKLLIVKNANDKIVSASFFNTTKNKIFSRYNGVINGDYEYIKKGAESALYYFLIDWAMRQGIKIFDFGDCRPFSTDGVFQYKKKWGAEMKRSSCFQTPEIFGLKITDNKSSLHEFFIKHSFYGIDEQNRFIKFE